MMKHLFLCIFLFAANILVVSCSKHLPDQISATRVAELHGVQTHVWEVCDLALATIEQIRHETNSELASLNENDYRMFFGTAQTELNPDNVATNVQLILFSKISNEMTQREVDALLSWFNTPLGMKIAEAERKAASSEAQAEQVMLRYRWKDATADETRNELLQKLGNALNMKEEANRCFNNASALAVSVASAALKGKNTGAKEILQHPEVLSNAVEGKERDSAMIAKLVTTYKDLTNDEVIQYIKWADSRPSKHYRGLLSNSLSDGIKVLTTQLYDDIMLMHKTNNN